MMSLTGTDLIKLVLSFIQTRQPYAYNNMHVSAMLLTYNGVGPCHWDSTVNKMSKFGNRVPLTNISTATIKSHELIFNIVCLASFTSIQAAKAANLCKDMNIAKKSLLYITEEADSTTVHWLYSWMADQEWCFSNQNGLIIILNYIIL